MKIAGCCLVLAMGAMVGCVELPFLKDGTTVPPAAAARHEPPPVTVDQVNDANAHEKAEALRKELDREAQQEAAPKASTTKVLP